MAAYLMYLHNGATLLHQRVKANTMLKYLAAGAKLCASVHSEGRDPRYRIPTDTRLCPAISEALADIRKYESIPAKKEPLTVEICRRP